MPEPEPLQFLPALRVVAAPDALDAALVAPTWPTTAMVARIASDDALVLLDLSVPPGTGSTPGPAGVGSAGVGSAAAREAMTATAMEAATAAISEAVGAADPFAIVEAESGFVGAWLDIPTVDRWVAANADWLLPHQPPSTATAVALVQGMVAALPVKILIDGQWALIMVPAVYANELAERAPVGPLSVGPGSEVTR